MDPPKGSHWPSKSHQEAMKSAHDDIENYLKRERERIAAGGMDHDPAVMPTDMLSFADRMQTIAALTDMFKRYGIDAMHAKQMATALERELARLSSSQDAYKLKVAEVQKMMAPASEDAAVAANLDLEREITWLDPEGPEFGPYENATHVAGGASSTVYVAKNKNLLSPNRIVALKVIGRESLGPPHDALREISILDKLPPLHIVPLIDAFKARNQLILVFPYFAHDLETLLRNNTLTKRQAYKVYIGLFKGLQNIHSKGIIHRDIKPSNIMLRTSDGPAYLIDFGIAWSPDEHSSEPLANKITDVGTTNYRPPEILFGDKAYDTSFDMWAAGCVMAEVVSDGHQPIFDSGAMGGELELLRSIITTLGTPNDEVWPSGRACPDFLKLKMAEFPSKPWTEIVPGVSPAAIDFMSKTVRYEMTTRITAHEALRHELRSTIWA